MVWRCFVGEKLGPLITFEQGEIGSEEYQDVLYDGLLSMVDDLSTPPTSETLTVINAADFIFVHDNATCHKMPDVQQLLNENHIPVMHWLAQSPNLNPIEQLWRELKHRFNLKFSMLWK